MKAGINYISVYLPENIVSNDEIEQKVVYKNQALPTGILEKTLGIKTRRFADKNTQVSDLACNAANGILSQIDRSTIDLLIFAAASSDLTEPATANIIQAKLGLTCPVLDVKNACNSVVSAIQVASAFIESGIYTNILIVNGEKLSEVINFSPLDDVQYSRCFVGYGLGDAGAAMLIGKEKQGKIIFQKFTSFGEYWDICTVSAGGSLAYRDLNKSFFEGNAKELREVFVEKAPNFILDCLAESHIKISDINCLIAHQVAQTTINLIATAIGFDEEKCINTFSKYGNTAAATIPLAINEAILTDKLKHGDKLLIIGLAAGISISVQLIEW